MNRSISTHAFVPVILGGDIGAYALGREFHEAYGIQPISVIQEPIGIIKHSRIFEHEQIVDLSLDEVIRALDRIEKSHPDSKILLMTNSEACIPVLSQALELKPSIVSPTPDMSIIERTSDKFAFGELCQEYGLETPKTERILLDGSAPIDPTEIPFPVVAKPAYSPAYAHLLNAGFKKVYFIERQEDLDALWQDLRRAGFTGTFLVQELIGGDDTHMDSITLYIDSSGRTTMYGGAQVLLEDHAPSMLGNPVAMITRRHPDLWEKCSSMLQSIGYRGFANFDIKRDPKTGRELLFEVNPRIGRNSYYNCAAGVNPMRHCVEDLVNGRELEPEYANRSILYSLVPIALLKRYIRDADLLAEVNRLVAAKTVFDPQRYHADSSIHRNLDILLTELNQFRKFRRYYPEPTETSF